MELVEGPTLADRIARGAVPLDEDSGREADRGRARIGTRAGIVHRDLNPANIKLRDDGTVKVLDFGLAKALDQDRDARMPGSRQAVTVTSPAVTAAGIILGTAAYMAPEQAKGRSVDARADIWAFGCVLFEMLAGRAPFAGESVVDILSTVIQRDPDWSALPAHTPAALRRLLRRCLDKDPKHRLAAIADARLDSMRLRDHNRQTMCVRLQQLRAGRPPCLRRWRPRPHDRRHVVGMVASVTRRSTGRGERDLRCRHSCRRYSESCNAHRPIRRLARRDDACDRRP